MTKGKVDAVRKDKTGLKIGEKWYSNNYLDDKVKEKLKEISVGDEVLVTLNQKGYLEDVKVTGKGKSVASSDNSKDIMFKLSYAKDLAVALIEHGNLNDKGLQPVIGTCVNAIKYADKKLKEEEKPEEEKEDGKE